MNERLNAMAENIGRSFATMSAAGCQVLRDMRPLVRVLRRRVLREAIRHAEGKRVRRSKGMRRHIRRRKAAESR